MSSRFLGYDWLRRASEWKYMGRQDNLLATRQPSTFPQYIHIPCMIYCSTLYQAQDLLFR